MYIVITDENDINYNYYKFGEIYVYDPTDIKYQTKCKTGLNSHINSNEICIKSFDDRKLFIDNKNCNYSYLSSGILLTKYFRIVIIMENDMLIMSERYNIFDPNVIRKFNIDIDEEYINVVCRHGNVNLLEWWKNSRLPKKYYYKAVLNEASYHGHVNVLEWWKNSELSLTYTTSALFWASKNGHVNVLEWWFKSNLPLKYKNYLLDFLFSEGQVNVLEWWFKSNLPLEYSDEVLKTASYAGRIDILECWKNSGLPLEYDKDSLIKFMHTEPINNKVVKWWENYFGMEIA
jgi:hypothetical protein